VAMSALERRASVGVHFREDAEPAAAASYHVRLVRSANGTIAQRV